MKGVKAILLASGNGDRFADPLPKQFHLLGGKPLYLHPLTTLISSQLFEEIILVCHPNWVDQMEVDVKVIPGGKTRQESSYKGLIAAGPDTEIILIHDAVRPFVTEKILRENIEIARTHGACDTCIPSVDTLVQSIDGRAIEGIPDRRHFLRGQTPQAFSFPLILEAHHRAKGLEATDDCQLVLELGHPVHIAEGDERNLKITTPFDLYLAEKLLDARDSQESTRSKIRETPRLGTYSSKK